MCVCARIHTQGWACVCPRGHRETGLPHEPQAELRLVGIEHRVGLRPWVGCQPRALLMRTLPAALTASRGRPRRPQPMGLGQTRDRTPGFAADGGAAVELRRGRSPGIVIRGLLRPLALPALRSLAAPPIYAPRSDADQLKEPRPTPLELGVPSGLRPPRASGWSWNPLCVVQSTRPVGAGFRQPWLWKPAPSLWPCPAGPIRGAPGLPRLHTPPTRRSDVWTALRPSGGLCSVQV